MIVHWEKLKAWHGCRAIGLGAKLERKPMGTTVGDPRPIVSYSLTVELLTRKLTITKRRVG